MENVLIASTLDEMRDLIRILLDNEKVILRVEKTMLQNYLVAWDDPEAMDE